VSKKLESSGESPESTKKPKSRATDPAEDRFWQEAASGEGGASQKARIAAQVVSKVHSGSSSKFVFSIAVLVRFEEASSAQANNLNIVRKRSNEKSAQAKSIVRKRTSNEKKNKGPGRRRSVSYERHSSPLALEANRVTCSCRSCNAGNVWKITCKNLYSHVAVLALLAGHGTLPVTAATATCNCK
jgi:hypothetical protein